MSVHAQPIPTNYATVPASPIYAVLGYIHNGSRCRLGREHVSPVTIQSSMPFELADGAILQGRTEQCPCGGVR